MTPLRSFFAHFRLSPEDRAVVLPPIARANRRRIIFVAVFGTFVSLVHIVWFSALLGVSSPHELPWRWQIIGCHIVLVAVFVTSGLTAWKLKSDGPVPFGLAHLYYAVLLGAGVTIALVDQQVTSAVTPYLIACLGLPLVLILPPVSALVCLGAASTAFVVGLTFVLPDSPVRLSSQVNGVTGFGLGMVLAVGFWSYSKTTILQNHRIEVQNRELQELNRTKDRFFSVIAHDLRGPFSGMIGVLDYLQDETEPLSVAEQKEALKVLSNTAGSLYRLLDNLLLWAKVQRGLTSSQPTPVVLAELLGQVRDTYSGMIQTRGVAVTLDCPSELTLLVDRPVLETVLRNLLSNSLKFTPSGGTITLSAQPTTDGVAFGCRDTGRGMTPELVEALFRVDQRSAHVAEDGSLGSGLGLILCYEFVAQLGGVLRAESTLGKGTVLSFVLPNSLDRASGAV